MNLNISVLKFMNLKQHFDFTSAADACSHLAITIAPFSQINGLVRVYIFRKEFHGKEISPWSLPHAHTHKTKLKTWLKKLVVA